MRSDTISVCSFFHMFFVRVCRCAHALHYFATIAKTLQQYRYAVSLSHCSLCQQLFSRIETFDWLIALLHDLVNSPHVRQSLSQFLHTGFICSCFQLVMFASSFKNALILEFPVSALYEAYVSMILVLNSLCTKMPPSQFNESYFAACSISWVSFQALTVRKPFMMSLVILVQCEAP